MNVRVAEAPIIVARARALDYVALLKLRLNVLVVMAVAASYYLAAPPAVPVVSFLLLLLGTLLAAGGASAVNMAMEAERDRCMERTRNRPVAAGRIPRDEAALFGVVCAATGVLTVMMTGGWLPALLTLATFLLYVLVYTPLKPRTSLNTLVGAVPGALPALVGWTAARNELPLAALSLFGIVFVWQFPHFLAIASMYRDEYERGGFRMLPVIDPTGVRTAQHAVAFALVFVPAALLPSLLKLTGPAYFAGAVVLGVFYLAATARAAWQRTPSAWRDLLRASLITLPGLFILMMIDRLPA